MPLTRREFLLAAGTTLIQSPEGTSAESSKEFSYLAGMRILLAEGYNPPFYPNLDYEPKRALEIARALNADSLRFPAAAYRAFFPTRTRYPRHPTLGQRDLLGETVELFHRAGLKVVVYLPLNHPFLSVSIAGPEHMDWVKKDSEGRPIETEHYGFDPYYETCLNSPVREEILKMVGEVVRGYDVDVVYFDGPYQGMQNDMRWCHCRHCQAAYRKARGRGVPLQDRTLTPEEEHNYVAWFREGVTAGFMQEVRRIVKQKPVPMLFNDTSLLTSRQWRNLLYPLFDGFMFEAATTPEQKMFNILLGKSTGKHIWSYVGSHTLYNREHLRNQRVRGWFSYPLEGEELRMDARMAMAAGAGLIYWGLARFFYMPDPLAQYESAGYVREAFDMVERRRPLLERLEPLRDIGILVSGNSIDWLRDRGPAYENYYHGAFQVLKDLDQQAEPFHDSQLSLEKLRQYRVVWLPNAVCLSDADCRAVAEYVRAGGLLIATHRTSLADERGRARSDFGLSELFGASYQGLLEYPDLYLRFPKGSPFRGDVVPQDPQSLLVKARDESAVLAETFDRGRNRTHGPALLRRKVGRGEVIYLASGLEAVYLETRATILRQLFEYLLAPWSAARLFSLHAPPGVWGHLAQAPGTLVLHLLANTGNKWKKLQSREQFEPAGPVEARVRAPAGGFRRARRWSDGAPLDLRWEDAYALLRLERVHIHEGLVLES